MKTSVYVCENKPFWMCAILYTRMLVCMCECASLSVRVCLCWRGVPPVYAHTHTRVLYTCKCAANVHNAMCSCSYMSEYAKTYIRVFLCVRASATDGYCMHSCPPCSCSAMCGSCNSYRPSGLTLFVMSVRVTHKHISRHTHAWALAPTLHKPARAEMCTTLI